MRRLRVGVVGCGAIAQIMHLPYLQELDDCFEIAALCDLDAARLEPVARRYRVDATTTDPDELLTMSLDAVAILSSGDHAPLVLAALGHGLHVFTEKPLTYTLAATDEVADFARKTGRTVMVGMHKRFDPAYERAVTAARSISDLRVVDAVVVNVDDASYFTHHALLGLPPWRRPARPATADELARRVLAGAPRDVLRDEFAAATEEAQVVAQLLNVSSIHDVDLLRGLLGEPRSVLSAHSWAAGTSYSATIDWGEDRCVSYIWTLVPGVRHYRQTFDLIGGSARVRLEFPSPYLRSAPTTLELQTGEAEELRTTRVLAGYEEPFRRELEHFHACVTDGVEPLTSVADSRRNLELLIAISAAFPSPTAA